MIYLFLYETLRLAFFIFLLLALCMSFSRPRQRYLALTGRSGNNTLLGATAIEYGLIAALITATLIAGAQIFGEHPT